MSRPDRAFLNPRGVAGAAALATLIPAALALAPAGARAGEMTPITVHVDKPLYSPSREGFEHFVEDELGKLVVGQKWDWRGHTYTCVKLARIVQTKPTGAHEQNRDYDAPRRGFGVAVVQVEMDGKLMRGRVEINASYVWQPAGWAWEQVLLYLGGADSYDFVKKKLV